MRKSGILLHLTSLPSPYGIGSMGAQAYKFADFLSRAGQSVWQLLPVCPTGYGNSPYQSYSTFAGSSNLIDLDRLAEDGLVLPEELDAVDWGSDPDRVDFAAVESGRGAILRKAAARFESGSDYDEFCRRSACWLEDYALFMALKDAHGGAAWTEWEPELRSREPDAVARARAELDEDIEFYRVTQYLFSSQWRQLKAYVNRLGIELVGDLPIYVALDSADVWSNPSLFMLDESGIPSEVAGCPPDAFTPAGQKWGNPLYNWDAMKQSGYEWWTRRIAHCSELFDITRIDHFRGFESFYCIPFGMPDARIGQWRKGPGIDLFRSVEAKLGRRKIIAEDLGFLTPQVRRLLRASGYPGMKIMQFAFDPAGDSDYMPHNLPKKCVVYTGTHDNDTAAGWAQSLGRAELKFARDYLRVSRRSQLPGAMIAATLGSVAALAVIPMQDWLGLGSEARMNTPSTVNSDNWSWRMLPDAPSTALADSIYSLTRTYRRCPCRKPQPTSRRKSK